MTRRRLLWMAIVWVVTLVVVTAWVAGQTGDDIDVGDGLLVGAVVATVLSAAILTFRRG